MLQRSIVFLVSIYGLRLRKGWLSAGPIDRHTRVTRVNDLIRVVTLHAKLLSGMRLSNIVGLRVCINIKYKNIILIKIYLLPNIPHL